MKTIAKRYNVYLNLGYWFMASLVLVFIGFYKSYFLVLFEPQRTIIHFHFLLMMIWVAMLIVQPFLIKYKKLPVHRIIGKLSYVIVPLMAFTTFMVMKYAFYNSIADLSKQMTDNAPKYSAAEAVHISASSIALPFVYLVWLILFYSLAIINKKHMPTHARYMLAAGLTITGPTVDRIFFSFMNVQVFPLGIPVETFSFVLIDIILALLLWKDYSEKRSTKTLWICLGFYVAVQVIYFTCPDTKGWEAMIGFLMRPAP